MGRRARAMMVASRFKDLMFHRWPDQPGRWEARRHPLAVATAYCRPLAISTSTRCPNINGFGSRNATLTMRTRVSAGRPGSSGRV